VLQGKGFNCFFIAISITERITAYVSDPVVDLKKLLTFSLTLKFHMALCEELLSGGISGISKNAKILPEYLTIRFGNAVHLMHTFG